jgi:hypothetical protein
MQACSRLLCMNYYTQGKIYAWVFRFDLIFENFNISTNIIISVEMAKVLS